MRLVGWLDGRVVLAFDDTSCGLDPTTKAWEGVPGDLGGAGPDLRARWADGGTWAAIERDGSVAEVAAGTVVHRFPIDPQAPWRPEWGRWADLLRPLPDRGYVAPLVGAAVHLGADGLTDQQLPDGYVAVTIAADGALLVRRRPDSADASALDAPYALFVWRPNLAAPVLVAHAVRSLSDTQAEGLAWLALADGRISRLGSDGQLEAPIGSWDPRVEAVSVSPTGRVIARWPLDGSSLRIDDLVAGTSDTIDAGCDAIAWHIDQIACLASPDNPSSDLWRLVVHGTGGPMVSIEIR